MFDTLRQDIRFGVRLLLGHYGVSQLRRLAARREMGIRALGARQRDLMSLVIRDGLLLVGVGLALGATGAALVSRLLSDFLYGISPSDPGVFIAVAVLLTAVMLTATFVPARRASKSDPLTALRMD